MDDGNLRSVGLHSPHCVPSSPRHILVAKELMRHLDDTTIGEETRESAKRERVLCKLVPVWIRNATMFGVKLWDRQAARIEAQRSEVYVGRVDICAVENTRRVLIGE